MIDAYSTHLHHTPEGGAIRAKQIRHLLAYVDSTRGFAPTVLAGDFNAELGTPEMNSSPRATSMRFAPCTQRRRATSR